MSADLRTRYLGMELANPVVPSASTLSSRIDTLRRLQDAGASAVVMQSLFEEQIEREGLEIHLVLERGTESFAEALTYLPELEDYNIGPEAYLRHLELTKRELEIPVIGSLNGSSPGGWVRHARLIEDAGADALELNVYFVAADPNLTSSEVEQLYIDLVAAVRSSVEIPLAVKVGPFFSSMANIARRLVEAGADGLVLFNRFLQPDIDLATLDVDPTLHLSTSEELRLPLRWVAILRGRVDTSLAATTGVHTWEDAVKLILAGADVTMMASALFKHGPEHVTTVLDGIKAAVPSTDVVWAPDQDKAVQEAGSADAVVAVVGEKPYAEGLGDNPSPALPADQQALIAALQKTGKPVIVVVLAGRPLALGPGKDAAGLLMAYLPGTEGGSGVADVLFGKVNPSAKLPVSWPSEATQNPPTSQFNPSAPSLLGDQPKFSDQLPGTNFGQGSGYNPLYSFGFGLSYTTFKVSGLSATGSVSRHGKVTARFTVANTGSRAGTDVVPVYVHQPVSGHSIVVPPKRLVGFARVDLDAGQSKSVEVSFPTSELAVTAGDIDGAGRREVQPGAYQVQVEDLSADFTIRS